MKTFFITTPLYYVNAAPHIGHAYTTIAADALARFMRQQGREVFFLTGTDEHGQKIAREAEKAGMAPQPFVDQVSVHFKTLWETLNIRYDRFIRTTDADHKQGAQAAFQKLMDSGDLYRGKYAGWYCVADERFWPENQLVKTTGPDGKETLVTPDLKRAVEWLEEESWFFRLSHYGPRVLAHIEQNPGFIQPAYRAQEIINRLKAGVEDLSVSRRSVAWGIPMPGDGGETIYVWFEALLNYVTAVGLGTDENRLAQHWPADAQFLGKDILWFHGVIWPALLMALGLELPVSLRTHGWWLVSGEKMSKSTGNVVDPVALSEKYGADALRYFLLRDTPFGQDGSFTEEALAMRRSADLANDLGNLLHRFLAMAQKYEGRRIPCVTSGGPLEKDVLAVFDLHLPKVAQAFASSDYHVALTEAFEPVKRLNKYIEETQPWALRKQKRGEELRGFLGFTAQQILRVAAALWCVLPHSCEEIFRRLGQPLAAGQAPAWDRATTPPVWDSALLVEEPGIPLFPALEEPMTPPDTTPAETTAAAPAPPEEDFISIDDFAKVKLVVGEVVSADAHPKADKLLRLQVNIGSETRQILAGIRAHYSPEELVGKQVVIVANLKPRQMRGEWSHGMLLAASGDEALAFVSPQRPVPPGSGVK